MSESVIDYESLKEIIKSSVKEAIKEERMNLSFALAPKVDHEEMQDIIKNFGTRKDYKTEEFEDISDWFDNED